LWFAKFPKNLWGTRRNAFALWPSPQRAEAVMASNLDNAKVLTFQQWIELINVSRSTGLRILDNGGPASAVLEFV
jgi:hypothetical protein